MKIWVRDESRVRDGGGAVSSQARGVLVYRFSSSVSAQAQSEVVSAGGLKYQVQSVNRKVLVPGKRPSGPGFRCKVSTPAARP